MKKADLHIHTTASDGKLNPSAVVDLAANRDIRLIAITDHDTIMGIDEAIKRCNIYDKITAIPGIELSTLYSDSEVHLLGYFIDYENETIVNLSKEINDYRYKRADKIVSKLQNLNIDISMEEVLSESKIKNIGRPHIARVLMKKGYVKDISEAFNDYLGKGKKAFVDRYKLSLQKGIDIIHECGGVAILAHPVLLNINIEDIVDKFDIDGIEVYHSKHSIEDSQKYLQIAKENNLYITGGSDFHGDKNKEAPNIGDAFIDIKELSELLDIYKYKV
ncbi:PHP domain-containing protein [Clostridium sp. D2Q-11]|uniref:PHP domain-containing protein n=1 Tax=Anaeromonas frigoriresistens TaxID=2683708 RepID=A0A942ZAM4_9FIRM|nr:PHP domain-containing protein [Anaeromonas frigoriresistens]MBS4539915.1 PHP domain-containing protein [Anaeromonas frigoriresistens]